MNESLNIFWRGFCYGRGMKRIYLSLASALLFVSFYQLSAQGLSLRKGIIIDSLKVQDSIQDSFSLFLPQTFQLKDKWPLLMVFDMKGQGKKEMAKFVKVANRYNYILAASNEIYDTVSLTENMLKTKRLVEHLARLLPINQSRIYTAGIEEGGRFANLVPIFLKDVAGTISVNAAIANTDLLNAKNSFHFIGVVDKSNFNYPTLLKDEKLLNGFKFPNSILLNGSTSMEDFTSGVAQAIRYFELQDMLKGNVTKDSILIEKFYAEDLGRINILQSKRMYLKANRAMAETLNSFRAFKDMDSLRERKKNLKRLKGFRAQKREEEAALFKETLLQEDFVYYLEEDVLTYNFNNLGWWSYQKEQIDKYKSSSIAAERQMGQRLDGYINALIKDNIDLVKNQNTVDEEALVFLYMLKTVTEPNNFDYYLKVASIASKNEDFGTALFYLEEVLKNGFKSKETLYNIPHTALLRITPEFNSLIKKYFDNARYKIIDR